MAQIIDGKAVSAAVKQEVADEAAKLREEKGLKVGLAVVIVGNNPASRVYVNNKKKACEAVGFQSFEYALDENTTQEQLLDLMKVLNRDDKSKRYPRSAPTSEAYRRKSCYRCYLSCQGCRRFPRYQCRKNNDR